MTDKGTQFGVLHWGPCVVHTKLQKPILDKYNRNIIENDLLPYIKQRIMDIDENELIGTLEEITKLLNYWEFRNDIKYFWNDKIC